MLNPDPERDALHSAVAEVALRANRLHELIELGDHYRQVHVSYSGLARGANAQQVDWQQLADIWLSFRNHELQILHGFIQNAEHIRQTAATEPAAGPTLGTTIDGWSGELENLCEQLEAVFNKMAQATLKQATTQLQIALLRHMAWHKNTVDREVNRLCRLTELLRDRLKTS